MSWEGVDRRRNDHPNRLDRLEDNMKEISDSHIEMKTVLVSVKDSLVGINTAIDKLGNIEMKHLVQENELKNLSKNVEELMKAKNGEGCTVIKELSKRVELNRADIDKQWEHIEKLTEKVTKLWIYGTVAIFIISLATKLVMEHFIK